MVRARRWKSVVALLVGLVAITAARDARAVPVDGVVGIIGERPILRSELQARAGLAPATREILERMIDERVEEEAAARARLVVSEDEVDARLERLATETKQHTRDVLADAQRRGVSEHALRDQLRRELLERKLVALQVRPRVQVTEQDLHAAYTRWRTELDVQDVVDLRIIVLPLPANATPPRVASTEALAHRIVAQARSGADFCALVRHYNPPGVGPRCGSYGPVPSAMLQPEMARATQGLATGEIASPVRLVDPLGTQSFLVVQKAPTAPPVPTLDEVRAEMVERALDDLTERARKRWLRELRRRVYIDVRL